MAPASDEAPNRCNDKIARDTACDELKSAPVSGKYNVHPADTPVSNAIATTNNWTLKTESQKAKLFNLGVAKSTKPNNVGT